MEIDAEKSELGLEANGIPVSVSADGAVIRSPRVNITTGTNHGQCSQWSDNCHWWTHYQQQHVGDAQRSLAR